MAHEIMNDSAMFYVGERPWHGLGTALDIPPSTDEALKLAGLDWHVHKMETMLQLGDILTGTGHYCTYRLDKDGKPVILGNVSEKYEVLQNIDAFMPFDEVLLDNGYVYETAGAIRDGKKIWVLAKAPDSMLVGDDVVEKYVLMFNSHDGSCRVMIKPTPIRVVCNNTLNMALRKSDTEVALKHTSGVMGRLEDYTNVLRAAEGNLSLAHDTMNRMAEVEMDIMEAAQYFETVFPNLANRGVEKRNPLTGRKFPDTAQPLFENLMFNFQHGRGNTGQTLWHAYNAVTEYVDHGKQYKNWVETTQFGHGDTKKVNAYKVAQQFIGA